MDRRRMRQIRTRIKIKGALPKAKSTPGFDFWNKVFRKFSRSDTGFGKASLSDMIKRFIGSGSGQEQDVARSDNTDSRLEA